MWKWSFILSTTNFCRVQNVFVLKRSSQSESEDVINIKSRVQLAQLTNVHLKCPEMYTYEKIYLQSKQKRKKHVIKNRTISQNWNIL